MKSTEKRKALRPLDESALNELALRYVGRFATTRAKLRSYLARKVRERGWEGAQEPAIAGIAERFAEQGYIDDAAYALIKSQALTGRGYGKRRLVQSLRVAGVNEDDGVAALDHADADAVSAALRFARRRRIGPYAKSEPASPKERDKALAAMVRAGHGFPLAKAVLSLAPGTEDNIGQLTEFIRLIDE